MNRDMKLRRRSPVQSLAVGLALGILVGVLVGPGRQSVEIVERAGDAPVAGDQRTDPGSSGTVGPTDLTPVPGQTDDSGVPAPIVAGPNPGSDATDSPDGTPTSGPNDDGPGTTGNVQGVTSNEIRIGIGVPDLGALAALGPNYDFGDPGDHMKALLEDWEAEGLSPVHGRRIKFFPRTYDILSVEAMIAACQGWAEDDKVFAVIAVEQYWGAPECVTGKGIPLITTLMMYGDTYAKNGHLLFDLMPSTQRFFRNWVHWMEDNGLLQGKTIGLYRPIGRDAIPITEALVPELEKLGYSVAEEVTTDNHSTGSPQDTVAVQRFKNRVPPVDLAILMTSAINATNFMQQADAQLYKPTYVMSDFIQSTNDVAASTFPPSQFDGTLAMTSHRYGEQAAGLGEVAEARECAENFAERRGRRVTYAQRPAEYLMLISGCDEGRLVMHALQQAGRNLSVDSFVRQMNSVVKMPMGLHADVTFKAGDQGGVREIRTLQWRANCTCYVAIDDWRPFYVN